MIFAGKGTQHRLSRLQSHTIQPCFVCERERETLDILAKVIHLLNEAPRWELEA